MATRNLFRFVSVRPPKSATVDDSCRLTNKEAGERFVEEVSTWQREHEASLRVARRAVSVTAIESADYFARSDTWKDLRPLLNYFQYFIAAMCRKEEKPDKDADVEATSREIGEKVRGWVVDAPDSFATAKKILWRSYYANALVPELRPNDRAEMLDWIRVLAALERLRPPSEDAEWRYDEEACACVERLNRARVNLPYELFAETLPSDPIPKKPEEDPVEEEIVALRASLKRLNIARRDLDQLYRRKVNALRLAPPPDREHGDAGARPGRAEAGDDAGSATAGQGPRSVPPPWLLTEEDAAELPELGAELDRLGVPLSGSLLPEVAGALDEAIAADTAALAALESRVDVLGIGPTMALARRTARGLRPAPRGGSRSVERAEPDGEEGAT
jgi:hypothetical protein